ncbi:MAG: AEC family transporter, partial [Proteobacteria bacterium]|nr:AEC family transporter [Pseudomonadota bacterium]
MIAQIAAIIAPVAIVVGGGALWDRLGRPFDTAFVTNLVFYVGAPALVFSTLSELVVLDEAWRFAGAAALALALFGLFGAAALMALRLPVRDFVNTLMYPNLGNMGLPLCLFAFGPDGLALAVVFFTVASLMHYTLGIWVLSGRFRASAVLRAPLVYAAAAAVAMQAAGMTPWSWVANTTSMLGNLTIPLLLLTLGVSLARIRPANIARGSILAVLRLGIGIAVGFGLAAALGLSGTARGVLILDAAMPA